MSFFQYYFNDYDFSKRETAVCCPFPHHTENGLEYFETNPSAHVNLDKKLFHCKVCNKGLSEIGFISEVLGCTYEAATKLSKLFTSQEDIFSWTNNLALTDEQRKVAHDLGIKDQVIRELNIATEIGDELAFPVSMFTKIVDVRSYRPFDRANKIRSRVGAISGLIIPFDEWMKHDPTKWTIICAGEKDMAVARSNGMNAITLTGGERALPRFVNPFKDKKFAICYDNDDAGIEGAKSLAAFLQPIAEEVKVVTGFHEVCKEHGEDITDFFMKYKKTAKDLKEYIVNTPAFTYEEAREEKTKHCPLITTYEASQQGYQGKLVQSNIQVVASYEKAMPVPTTIYAKKLNTTGEPKYNQMMVGEERNWELNENNCEDILKLIDNNFTEAQIRDNIREILKIGKYERDISVTKPTKETVYQCNVVDLLDSTSENVATIEFNAYVIKKRLESGKKYLITYKLVPHPYKGQQLTMIILSAEEVADSVSNFVVTDGVKQRLKKFAELEGTVAERVDKITEMLKSRLGYNGYNKLIQAIDLSYHTVMSFNFGSFKDVRGYLDTLVVAESRIGKSSTATALQKLYGLGVFASLAGNSATIPGLIGGSNKVNGNFQTRAGLIPMNHRGLIIFEELAKCNNNIIRELTDIRSSNQVRIARVSGSLVLPAMVRMITLSNAASKNNKSMPIASYPYGIDVLEDLIGTAEDIARYDLMLVMSETHGKGDDPFWNPPEPFEDDDYKARVRWVWSRTTDQVIINQEVGHYIMSKCNELNNKYDCHIKIFGTEAWKKVSRLAIAVAGYLVSTDPSFEKIIVTKEHVDYACNYLVSCYDNPTFKFKEYVDMERSYTTIDDDGVAYLQEIYNHNPSMCLHLERCSRTNRQNLIGASGLDNEMYHKLTQKLSNGLFITYDGYDILPTQRFRMGMTKINRNANIPKVGELDA